MKLVFLTCTKRLPTWLETLTADYEKKLSYWFQTQTVALGASNHSRDSKDRKKTEESATLFDYLKSDDFVVLCDEVGPAMSSKKFADKVEKIIGGGKKRLIVVVGGAYGVDEALKKRADLVINLSGFTLNHYVALAVVCEQVYRAMTILKGIQYHND